MNNYCAETLATVIEERISANWKKADKLPEGSEKEKLADENSRLGVIAYELHLDLPLNIKARL